MFLLCSGELLSHDFGICGVLKGLWKLGTAEEGRRMREEMTHPNDLNNDTDILHDLCNNTLPLPLAYYGTIGEFRVDDFGAIPKAM